FNDVNDTLFALAGISRCGKATSYPANITLTNADGTSRTVNFAVKVNATPYPVQDITLTPQMAALLDPAIEIAENNRVANTVTPFTSSPAWSGPFSPPLGQKDKDAIITAVFGNKRSYNGGAPGLCGHEGQDFAIDGGTPVYAPAGGKIVLAEPLHVRGNVIFINHGLGVYSAFFHLSEIDVKDGQVVKQGDLLGKVGTTGFSTGNHLHWSMWAPAGVPDPGLENRQDVYVDPIQWENRTIP
ncbi:MAG: M23 family metallopeptidase, partial [Rudaea sp.]